MLRQFNRRELTAFMIGLLAFVILFVAACSHGKPHTPDAAGTFTTTSKGNPPVKYQNSQTAPISGNQPDELVTAGVEDNLGVGKTGRAIRDIECQESPPGVIKPCILCNGEYSVHNTDDNGHTCDCLVCHPATYKKTPCRCTADGKVETDTVCKVLLPGDGFMPVTNVCEKPYPCSKCPGDLISVKACGGVDDTVCDCPRDHYQTGPLTCEPIPLCDVDHQRQLTQKPGSDYTSFECTACPDGMYQPFHNSAELCRPKPKATTPNPPTSVPSGTESQDGPCQPCTCDSATTDISLDDLCDLAILVCNTAVEHIYAKGHMIAICILAILIPVAFIFGLHIHGRKLRNVICRSTNRFFCRSNSSPIRSEETQELNNVGQSADNPASSNGN